MANCYLCGKKVGFFDARGFLIEENENTILCDECTTHHYRLVGDLPATENMKEDAAQYLNQFLSDNTLDESIKALLEKNIKAFQIEHEKKLAEEANNEPVQQEIYEPEKLHIDYEIHGENPLYDIQGNRGRRLYVYEHKCIIQVDVTLGSVLTHNATDGEKTIYYKDVIGVQLKKEGLLIGYLQLETAAEKGNNKNSNFFDENSFTFNKYEDVHQAYKYIISRLDEIKRV